MSAEATVDLRFEFGDIVENGRASEDNPFRTGFFVRRAVRRSGLVNSGPYIVLTDGKGKFWEMPLDAQSKIAKIGSIREPASKDTEKA